MQAAEKRPTSIEWVAPRRFEVQAAFREPNAVLRSANRGTSRGFFSVERPKTWPPPGDNSGAPLPVPTHQRPPSMPPAAIASEELAIVAFDDTAPPRPLAPAGRGPRAAPTEPSKGTLVEPTATELGPPPPLPLAPPRSRQRWGLILVGLALGGALFFWKFLDRPDTAALEEARKALQEKRYPDAWQALARARESGLVHPDLDGLTATLEAAPALDLAEKLLEHGDFAGASRALDEVKTSDDSRLLRIARRLREAAPVSATPVLAAPVSAAPVSEAPVSAMPALEAPVSQTPVSEAPVSQAPASGQARSRPPRSRPPRSRPPRSRPPRSRPPRSRPPGLHPPPAPRP
jgi:hypothetical protein